MAKEIAIKIEQEIYPVREPVASNGASCKCKKIWIDGCEDYVRVGGNEGDYEVITK